MRDIIVIAGSAGAVQEIMELVAALPEDFPGSVFIVVHTSAEGPGLLAGILRAPSRLPATKPTHCEAVKRGHVYVAPPNHHLLLVGRHMELDRGPRENGFRPAADPLFRSAAFAYGPRVVGIIVSGGMNDGTLGLQEIKRHGGVAIVQSPDDALHPGMPESAMRNVQVDHVLPIGEMPRVLLDLAQDEPKGAAPMKPARSHAADIPEAAATRANGMAHLEGPPSSFICPECGGALWELENGRVLHYRCHVGHGYTADALVAGHDGKVEEAMWVALRTLEETAALRRRLADQARTRHMPHVAVVYEERAHEIEERAGIVREVLLRDRLPSKLKGYTLSQPSKFLSRIAEQSSAGRRKTHAPAGRRKRDRA